MKHPETGEVLFAYDNNKQELYYAVDPILQIIPLLIQKFGKKLDQ